MTQQLPPSHARIADARARIVPEFLDSSLLTTEVQGMALAVKDETDNPIRSFKGRGAHYFLASHASEMGPLVTASAGNFGQGLAHAAARHGRRLTVFASLTANPVKIEAMRRLGAEVILQGRDFDAAKAFAKDYASSSGLPLIEDGASAAIAEGAGTIAAELTDSFADIDVVFVPLGNGALAAGVGCWFKAVSPATRVIAVAAQGAPCMALSWNAGKPIVTDEARTIADGIAIRVPVPSAVAWLADTIDDVVLVDDHQIIEAMRFAHATWGRLVEPAGAAGLAGVLASSMSGLRVATVLCGGNLTNEQIEAWLSSAGANGRERNP